MLTLVVAVALTCMPAPFEDSVVASADGGFTLDVKRDSLTLREGQTERWVIQQPPEPPEFERYVVGDDGSWVAIIHSPTRDLDGAVMKLLDAKGKARDVKPFSALTKAERNALPVTSCGRMWLAALRVNGNALEFDVFQGGIPLPIQDPATAPVITLKLDVKTGKVARLSPLKSSK